MATELQERIAALGTAAERLPRVPLAHVPTPLHECPRLSAALGDVRIWMKRDDLTGLALGGNKTRQLEFTLGEAIARGADCVVHGASSQSNHCRQAAAACARLGLDCILCLTRDPHAAGDQGNLLLDRLFGAEVRFFNCGIGPEIEAAKAEVARELEAAGRSPYLIGGERARVLGAVALALMTAELASQLDAAGIRPDAVYVCSAGPTGAGLELGRRLLGLPYPVVSVAPVRWPFDTRAAMAAAARGAARELGLPAEVEPETIRLEEGYLGPGYGVLTREGEMALRLVARTEGILLDPVYTGKAMAGMIDHVRRGRIAPGSTLVFVHTGGTPALFAYAEDLR